MFQYHSAYGLCFSQYAGSLLRHQLLGVGLERRPAGHRVEAPVDEDAVLCVLEPLGQGMRGQRFLGRCVVNHSPHPTQTGPAPSEMISVARLIPRSSLGANPEHITKQCLPHGKFAWIAPRGESPAGS